MKKHNRRKTFILLNLIILFFQFATHKFQIFIYHFSLSRIGFGVLCVILKRDSILFNFPRKSIYPLVYTHYMFSLVLTSFRPFPPPTLVWNISQFYYDITDNRNNFKNIYRERRTILSLANGFEIEWKSVGFLGNALWAIMMIFISY